MSAKKKKKGSKTSKDSKEGTKQDSPPSRNSESSRKAQHMTTRRHGGIAAEMPVRITSKAKAHLKELEASGKIKGTRVGRVHQEDSVIDKDTTFGMQLVAEGDSMSISLSHPVIATSAVVPRQRDQGDFSLRRKTKRLAERLRKKHKSRRTRG